MNDKKAGKIVVTYQIFIAIAILYRIAMAIDTSTPCAIFIKSIPFKISSLTRDLCNYAQEVFAQA